MESDFVKANYLDKNHSHYLLVDDGSHGLHGRASEVRLNVLRALARGKYAFSQSF